MTIEETYLMYLVDTYQEAVSRPQGPSPEEVDRALAEEAYDARLATESVAHPPHLRTPAPRVLVPIRWPRPLPLSDREYDERRMPQAYRLTGDERVGVLLERATDYADAWEDDQFYNHDRPRSIASWTKVYEIELRRALVRMRRIGPGGGVILPLTLGGPDEPEPVEGWAASCGRCPGFSAIFYAEAKAESWLERHASKGH